MNDTGEERTRTTQPAKMREPERQKSEERRMFWWFGIGLGGIIVLLVIVSVSLW